MQEKKRSKRALEEQIMREIEASDSDDATPIQSDKCYACNIASSAHSVKYQEDMVSFANT
jgi:hypothetical protein